jgi:hypothetical protein
MFEILGAAVVNRFWGWSLFFVAPFICVFLFLFYRFTSLQGLEEIFRHAELSSQSALEKRACKEQFLDHYAQSDPSFLSHHLESLPLLSDMRKMLLKQLEHPACAERGIVRKRLKECEKASNRIVFVEERSRSSKRTKETDQHLLHPVEIGLKDLEQILTIVEEIPIGSFLPIPNVPQLVITECSLSRKNNSYLLDLALLKREFIYE